MSKIIAIKVDEETWRKWKELNKFDNFATKKTREFLNQMFEENRWLMEMASGIKKRRESYGELDIVSAREILSEI